MNKYNKAQLAMLIALVVGAAGAVLGLIISNEFVLVGQANGINNSIINTVVYTFIPLALLVFGGFGTISLMGRAGIR